jgi:hypothetical protein
MPEPATCRYCGAPIVWLRTANGRPIPCEPRVLVTIDEDGVTHRGREAHHAHCPQVTQARLERRRLEAAAGLEAP